MKLQARDRVTIIDDEGSPVGEGTIVNVNEYREPELKYAVDVDGFEMDLLFFGEKQLMKNKEELTNGK